MQPCAICKGPTEKRDITPGYTSNYCAQCNVYTADSDGKEKERWARFNDIRAAIIRDYLRRERAS